MGLNKNSIFKQTNSITGTQYDPSVLTSITGGTQEDTSTLASRTGDYNKSSNGTPVKE